MSLIKELNERALLKKIGTKIVDWTDKKAAQQLIKSFDSGTTMPEMVYEWGNLPKKNRDDLRAAIQRYLKNNSHKRLESFYKAIGGEG